MALPNIGKEIPFNTDELVFVRLLEEFSGDILVEYHSRNRPGNYIEKWCDYDANSNTVRYLRVRTEAKLIAEYLAMRITLYELLTKTSDGIGFLVDRSNNQITSLRVVLLSELSSVKYLPDMDTLHDITLRPRWEQSPINVLIDDGWNANLLASIERNCQSAYSFVHFTQPGSQRKIPITALNYDYDGGYSMGQCFGRLRDSVPDRLRVKTVSVAAASPGILSLQVSHELYDHIYPILKSLHTIKNSFKQVHAWSKLNPRRVESLDIDNAKISLQNLCNSLRVDFESLFPSPTEDLQLPKESKMCVLNAGKITASYYRLLCKLTAKDRGYDIVDFDTDESLNIQLDSEDDSDDGDEF